MKMIIGIAAMISLTILAASVLAEENRTATVSIIAQTCGMNLSANGIGFGTIVAGEGNPVSSTDSTVVHNTGNIALNPTISGDCWRDGGNCQLTVDATEWSSNSGSIWTALTGSSVAIGSLTNNGDSETVNYRLTVPANTPAETLTQTITFGTGC